MECHSCSVFGIKIIDPFPPSLPLQRRFNNTPCCLKNLPIYPTGYPTQLRIMCNKKGNKSKSYQHQLLAAALLRRARNRHYKVFTIANHLHISLLKACRRVVAGSLDSSNTLWTDRGVESRMKVSSPILQLLCSLCKPRIFLYIFLEECVV